MTRPVIRPQCAIAFCAFSAGLTLGLCANAEATDFECRGSTAACIDAQTRRIRDLTEVLKQIPHEPLIGLLENREWCFLDEGKATRLAICSGEGFIDTGIVIDQDRWGRPLDGGVVRSRMPVSVDPTVPFQALVDDDFVDNNTHQSETLFVLSKTQLDHIIEQHGGKP